MTTFEPAFRNQLFGGRADRMSVYAEHCRKSTARGQALAGLEATGLDCLTESFGDPKIDWGSVLGNREEEIPHG
ncbi:MAG TPA: hypothetical protein VGT07_05770 [Steroidobacteraceae bacterium]|nr:hypothetical protein [Steroidobacteraceae bacterium]